jgi:hypothetical protein
MDNLILEGLSDQHLNAYGAKLGDNIRKLQSQIDECKSIHSKVLCIKKERELKKFNDKQLNLI